MEGDSRPRYITDNPDVAETEFDRFLPACHDDSYCQPGLVCDTDGPNVNGDEEYYFCTEPAGPTA